MNLIVNKNSSDRALIASDGGFNLLDYFIAAGLFLFTFLSFGIVSANAESADLLLLAMVNMILFFVAIFLYFGIARLAYKNRNYLLWGSAVCAFVAGYLFSGLSSFWTLFSSFSMLIFSGALVGRLTRADNKQIRVYIVGMIPVIIFTVIMLIPSWHEFLSTNGESFDEFVNTVKEQFLAAGFGDSALKMVDIFIRIIPSVQVLSSVIQFSIGYLIFIMLLEWNTPGLNLLKPFRLWKIPFGTVAFVLFGIGLRLTGAEPYAQIGDNILVFMIVFYVVSGLALIEFYLKKFNFSLFFKILFYIMMFFTGVLGFLASGLLGFVDSFTDWRKVQQLNLEKK